MRAARREDGARARSFECGDALYAEFEARAVALGCSVDWLLGEAMQRLLAETQAAARASSFPTAPPPPLVEGRALVSDVAPVVSATVPAPAGKDDEDPTDEVMAPTEEWASRVALEEAPADKGLQPTIALVVGGRRWRVDRDPFVIGRMAAADVNLVIEQEGVSRRHAMLERGESGWVIFDLGSTNGLLVNGAFVAGASLRAGDMVSLGPVLIVVEDA
ncbi:MAG: FHA domain-containing protein [Labilithrix sp.]|nr:FHA domain-containing protein [Labilithrix sp.]